VAKASFFNSFTAGLKACSTLCFIEIFFRSKRTVKEILVSVEILQELPDRPGRDGGAGLLGLSPSSCFYPREGGAGLQACVKVLVKCRL
jgi:hypothetical protein